MLVTSIFSFSLTMFSIGFFYKVVKNPDCVVKSALTNELSVLWHFRDDDFHCHFISINFGTFCEKSDKEPKTPPPPPKKKKKMLDLKMSWWVFLPWMPKVPSTVSVAFMVSGSQDLISQNVVWSLIHTPLLRNTW